MTKFEKSKFVYDGGWLSYEGKFVARFKYKGGPFTKAVMLKELMNYSQEEYFEATKGGLGGETPLGFLTSRNPEWERSVLDKFRAKFAL